jgi:hypothetical protein
MEDKLKRDKAAFFASNIGCEIEYPDTDGRKIVAILTGVSLKEGLETTYKRKKKDLVGDYLSFTPNGNHDCDAISAKIMLKSLADISDEDAIEVANRNWGGDYVKYHNPTDEEKIQHVKRTIGIIVEKYYIADYLRSRGYIVGFREYTTDQLIEMGWARLRQ